jgi:hypothetical protein
MQEMEMRLFDAMEAVIDTLADGVLLADPNFTPTAIARDEVVAATIARLVNVLRQEFCQVP